MTVYKITNSKNDKVYIGQTTGKIGDRFCQHVSKARANNPSSPLTALHSAIKKYGADCFVITTICRANSQEELDRREQLCIRLFKSLAPCGYNLKTGGGRGLHSEETKKKISERHLGTVRSLESRLKQSLSVTGAGNHKFGKSGPNSCWYGKHHTPEHRRKMSELFSGKNNPQYGKKLSESHKAALLAANKGKKRSDAHKLAISMAHKGRVLSEETRQKISKAMTGRVGYLRGKKAPESTVRVLAAANEARKKRVLCHQNQTVYCSINEASRSLGVSKDVIRAILNKKNTRKKDLTFSFVSEGSHV